MHVIYEVNLIVDRSIAPEFEPWLSRHVQEMLTLPGFVSAEIAEEECEPAETASWSVRYRLIDRQALENYFNQHAERMRADGLARFNQQFSASRRILLPVEREPDQA